MIFNTQISGGGGGGTSGTVYQDGEGYLVLSDESGQTYQSKSVSYTPSETAQSATVTADAGYDSLSSVSVSVGAISSTYVGSGITRRSSSDLTASGATVSVPSGYYSSNASKAVSSGSATAPSTISGTSATVSTGTNTLTLSKTVSVTPSVTAGYISSGTAGNASVSLTASVNTRSSSDLTASGATVTAPAGYYASSASTSVSSMTLPTAASSTSSGTRKATIASSSSTQYINIPTGYNSAAAYYQLSAPTAMTLPTSASSTSSGTSKATISASTSDQYLNIPTGYNGTASYYKLSKMPSGSVSASASKGMVSNHSVSVTPTATVGTAGYLAAGSTNGTAVTVSASELVSGSQTIDENDTYDVTNLASVTVAVPSGGGATLLYSGTLGSISTSSSTAEVVTTINLGSTAWDYTKILYISIWRTTNRYSTPRKPSSSGYGFLGTESFYLGWGQVFQWGQDEKDNVFPQACEILRYANGYYLSSVDGSTAACGVYPSDLTKAGVLTISKKYSSAISGDVSGSYDIAVYQLEYPHGDPWFGRFS